ncbi:helix-turn-helix domain-containing protein [Aeromicrobium panaciterrae]|uniref:winged helix-turn-helix transcriptional regulator n=1 Tax=Aeromicrobium panaciterrae TaxID=363861 RepID=UPI0031E465C7
MPPRSKALADAATDSCAITRSLGVLSDSWSFLLLREALFGRRTFAEFVDALGIATDVLSVRLASLVEHGVMEKIPYREPGQRTRFAYELTPTGEKLNLVLAALQQWGDEHLPSSDPLAALPLDRHTHDRLRVAFVDPKGRTINQRDAQFLPAASSTDRAHRNVSSLRGNVTGRPMRGPDH